MTLEKTIIRLVTIVVSLLPTTISFGVNSGPSEAEQREYKQELMHIVTLRKSLKPGKTNDLQSYEKFADEIQKKWIPKNREHNARLMLEICRTLSSGNFNDNRRHDLARKYALSVLDKPEELSVEMELELTGHVVTLMYTPSSPRGEDFAQRRKKDVEIRLHAWNRLIDAVDPTWDPNDEPLINVPTPPGTTLSAGAAPQHIKDPKLRAEYEAAIEKNRQKAERYNEQYRLRDWMKRFPKRTEEYIILAYSEPPFNLEELKQYLDKYIADEKTRSRILDTVKKNMEAQAEKTRNEPAKAPPANSTPR